MIQELNLSPLGYLILLAIVAILAYLVMTAPSKTEAGTVEYSEDTVEQELNPYYGAIIQMQGR